MTSENDVPKSSSWSLLTPALPACPHVYMTLGPCGPVCPKSAVAIVAIGQDLNQSSKYVRTGLDTPDTYGMTETGLMAWLIGWMAYIRRPP